MKRTMGLAAAFAVVAGLVVVAPASPALACSGPSLERPGARHGAEVIRLSTFEVTMAAMKKAYEIGGTAKVHVTVKRPAQHDPLGQGIPWDPPDQQAAEDVAVGIGLRVGDVFLSGWGYTDAKGEVMIKIPIPRYVRPGRALAVAQATSRPFESPCLTVEEWGYTQSPYLFKVS